MPSFGSNDRVGLSRSAVEKYYEERYGEKLKNPWFIIQGVAKNIAAVNWYVRLPNKDMLMPSFISWMYARGWGIDQDNEEAANWYGCRTRTCHS